MNPLKSIILLAAIAALSSGCISRTVTVDHENRGKIPKSKGYGSQPGGAVIEKKTIWFWQKDFRSPK